MYKILRMGATVRGIYLFTYHALFPCGGAFTFFNIISGGDAKRHFFCTMGDTIVFAEKNR